MIFVGFLVLFGLICVLFSCEGQVYPPSDDDIVFLPGSTARIEWTYKGDASQASLFWYFKKNSDSTEEDLAARFLNDPPRYFNSSLPGIAIEDPATLVLKNVDQRYDGRYRLSVTVSGGGGESIVDVFIAAKPNVAINNWSDPITVNEGGNFTRVCQSQGGNPPANLTWHKDGVQIGNASYSGENILTLTNVTKQDSGRYTCKAQSYTLVDEESFDLIVHYKPTYTTINVPKEAYIGKKFTISCTSDGLPVPNITISHNGTIVSNKSTYTKDVVQDDAGTYKCTAKNVLGTNSDSGNLIVIKVTSNSTVNCTSPTTLNKANTAPNKQDDGTTVVVWHIVVTLVSGIIIGIIFSYIVWSSYRRWFRNKKPEQNTEPKTSEVDTTYQELDLSKMNKEDNYQSLGVNAARNDAASEDDSTYTQLNKIRDMEDNYQALK